MGYSKLVDVNLIREGISEYPQADREKLANVDIRSITGLSLSARTVTLSWEDAAGTSQTSQIVLPPAAPGGSAASLTTVSSQEELDAVSTSGVSLAVVVAESDTYQYAESDLLVYDHADQAWEKAGNFAAASLGDGSVTASMLDAEDDAGKAAMRARIGAASTSDVAASAATLVSAIDGVRSDAAAALASESSARTDAAASLAAKVSAEETNRRDGDQVRVVEVTDQAQFDALSTSLTGTRLVRAGAAFGSHSKGDVWVLSED